MFGAITGAFSALGGADIVGKLAGGLFGQGGLTKLFSGGGLLNPLLSLFGGGQQQQGQGPEALLHDIKDMLSQLLAKGDGCGGAQSHGCYGGETMKGGWGNDHLEGGCGNDRLYGGRGRDHLEGGCGDDRLYGGRGRDHLEGGCGDDRLHGGRGRDHLEGGCGDDRLHGGRGRDHLEGGCGDDHLYGGRGRDILEGGHGHNHLNGGRGSDRYIIENGSDNIIRDGKGKNDTVVLDGNRDDYNFERRGNDLIVTGEDGTRVVVKDQFSGGGVDKLKFDDETVKKRDFDDLLCNDHGCEPCDPEPPSCGGGGHHHYPQVVHHHHYYGSDDRGGHDGPDGGGPDGGDCGNDGGHGGGSCSI